MPERFGDVLRKQRRQTGRTLGDLSKLLGLSVVYLSDVERGNRRPLNKERILKVAKYLETDAAILIETADWERGVIEYDITRARPLEARVVGGLVSGLARGGVTEEQLEDIQKILQKDGEDNE